MCIIHLGDASHFQHSGLKAVSEAGLTARERRDYVYFMRTIRILMMQPENVSLMILDYVYFYVFRFE